MAPDALLLDLDGTVWDSEPWYSLLSSRPGGKATLAVPPAATRLQQAGVSRARFRRLCLGSERPELYPEVEQTLNELIRRKVPLGAVTNLPAWIADPMLEAAELARCFGVVITATRGRRNKPHPDPLLRALTALGIPASRRTWYVGDAPGDQQAAAAAGVSFAWASWGYGRQAPPGTDQNLDGFDDLLAL